MMPNDGCSRLRRVALILGTIWLSGSATRASERVGRGASSPVVEYSREVQARAAEELALLPDGSAISELWNDYAVMPDQARGYIR
ncbi:hypothetical protein SAMN04515678_10125 [Roseivivax sediminis]|uniref:Uncharacterized protein n=1 Tax=Roseivivax sediminis TaxID=936889 RepID=A0A1I1S803_9RHOB|nr:hypothetical protein SAMN04515678_10125 [Roseivivax sediminis]